VVHKYIIFFFFIFCKFSDSLSKTCSSFLMNESKLYYTTPGSQFRSGEWMKPNHNTRLIQTRELKLLLNMKISHRLTRAIQVSYKNLYKVSYNNTKFDNFRNCTISNCLTKSVNEILMHSG